MKIVFMLSDGRRIDAAPGPQTTCSTVIEIENPGSVKWCEDLWKLEDKR